MDEQYFKVALEDGTEQQCRVILTFDSDDYSYVLYTLVEEDGHESEEVSALRFEMDDQGQMTNFTSLETDEEWDMVDEVLNTLVSEFGDGDEDFFTISTEDDEEVVCEIIHRFELGEFNKSYILYAYADQEEINEIFASAYIPGEQGEVMELLPIETDKEWELVENELASVNQQE